MIHQTHDLISLPIFKGQDLIKKFVGFMPWQKKNKIIVVVAFCSLAFDNFE